jgi:cytoskeletal protein CcmA (bactofilin family)
MKKLFLLGIFILAFWIPANCTQAANGWGVGNYLMGNRVVVGPEEIREGGFTVAGADLELKGKTKGGIRAFGANVMHSGEVEGEMMVFGANVTLAGKYHGKVRAAAANLTLSGTFDGHVVAGAAKITVAPSAVIQGDLIYSAASLDRQEGSQIRGKVVRREFKEQKEWVEKAKEALFCVWVAYWVLSIPALLIVGVLIHHLFPKTTDSVVTALPRNPWKNIGVGLVFVVLVPVGVVIALVTLVGIPTGIIAALLYGTFIYTSRIFIAVWIGRKILGYFKKSLSTAFFWPLLLGTLITTLLLIIPILGCFFWLFFIFFGIGAMWMVIWRAVQGQRTESLPESPEEGI